MRHLSRRSDAKERIDEPFADPALTRQTHQQIHLINLWTWGYRPVISAVGHFLSKTGAGRASILDIGCGNGSCLQKIARWGRRHNHRLELTGIDIDAMVIGQAAAAPDVGALENIRFICGNVLEGGHDGHYDLVISSLTAHHLDDGQLVQLLRWMSGHARWGWFICDLDRSRLAYCFIKGLVHLGRFNAQVRHDAPLSVARGFKRQDWQGILSRAGLKSGRTQVHWYPNFRYGVRHENIL